MRIWVASQAARALLDDGWMMAATVEPNLVYDMFVLVRLRAAASWQPLD
jgi:hypothetical protein